MRDFDKPRDVPIFRPYDEEVPVDLIGEVEDEIELDYVRVAKWNGDVVAAYRVRRLSEAEFLLLAVGVRPAFRGRGLGRWMLGHAIGLAETKGCRAIVVADARTGSSFYQRFGFKLDANGALRLELPPE